MTHILTPEQRAQLKIQNEMRKRTSTSIFDARGQLNHSAAQSLSEGNLGLGEYLDLSMVPFAPDPDGSDHATNLSRLVAYIAKLPSGANGSGADWGGVIGGPLDDHETKVLHAVAMLYSTGRQTRSDAKTVETGRQGYEERSASIADTFLRAGGGANTYWAKQEVRDDVCRLIYKHNDPAEIRADKRLQVFEDARRYETTRYSPNTSAGMTILLARCKSELYYTGWARDKANFRNYMLYRSWK